MKKFVSVLLASVMASLTLASCQSNDSKTTEKGSDAGKKDVTLDVVWFSDGKEGESFMGLTEEYRKDHPNVKFELIEVPYGELDNKLRNMVSAKEQPALARMTNVGPFLSQLIDLKEYVGDDFADQFGTGLQYIFDGKMLGAPMEVTANGVIYNKTAFDKAGVKVPQNPDEIWTWDEFEKALVQVMEKGDVKYGLGLDYTPNRTSTILYEFGGGMLSEDLKTSDFKNDGNKQAVDLIKHLHDADIMPKSVFLGSDNPMEIFRSGQLACHIGGSWQISNYKDQIKDFEWGVTYLPKGTQRSTVPGGKWISAFNGTGTEQEAADFIKWISEPENNAKYCKDNLFLSQVKGNESLDYDYGKEFFEIFSNELNASTDRPGTEWGYQAFTGVIGPDFKENIASVVAGDMTTDEFLEKMDQAATAALKDLEK